MLQLPIQIKETNLVVQSNTLVDAIQDMTTNEKKLSSIVYSSINPRNEDFDEYIINPVEISRALGLGKKNEYRDIISILERLQTRLYWIHAPNEKDRFRLKRIPVISSTSLYPETNQIGISLDKDLKPHLLQLKKLFTQASLDVELKLKSFFDIRFYELLIKNRKLKKITFSLEDLRDKLGLNKYDLKGKIKKRKYVKYYDFKRYVLEPSRENLLIKDENGKHISDVSFEYREIKQSRRITHIEIIIHNNNEIGCEGKELSSSTDLARDALKKYGVKGDTAQKYLDQQEEAEILRCITLLEQAIGAGKVKSSNSGYLLKLLEKRAGQESEYEKSQREEKEKAAIKKQKKQAKKDNKERVAELSKAFSKRAKKEFLDSLSGVEKEQILLELREENPTSANFIKSLESGSGSGLLVTKIPNYEERKQAYIQENL